jgi:hypothetical protein
MSYKVDSTILEKLEYEINKVPYDGMPLGHSLSYYLYVELYLGIADYSYKSLLKDKLTYFYYYFITPKWARSSKKNVKMSNNTFLFTICGNRNNLLGLVKPVVDSFDYKMTTILGYDICIENQFDSQFIPWTDIPSINISAWRKKIKLVLPHWLDIVDKWIKKYKIRSAVSTRIINTLILQSLYAESFRLLLKENTPKKIITEADRFWFTAPLIIAANYLQIPTISLLHGVVNNSYGYMPLIANKLIVWGNRQKAQLVEYGLDPEKIYIGGAPHLQRERKFNNIDVKKKLHLSDNPIVIFGSAFIDENEAKKLMRIFCEAFNNELSIHAIVKIHHSESKEFYKEEIREFPNIIFYDNKELTFDESMALADMICVYNSAYGTDALIHGHAVAVMNINSTMPGNSKELIEVAQCPEAANAQQLKEIVFRYFSDKMYKEDIHNKAENYVSNYCYSFGKDAAITTHDIITSEE